jgi:hypothetical protein
MGVVHALLIGVSDYPNLRDDVPASRTFGLEPLESAAATVVRMAEWLESHRGLAGRPLGSIVVLSAPSLVECEDPAILQRSAPCSHGDFMREVAAWRSRASQDPDDLAFFYFAGHGVQRKQRDHVLLLQDFGEDPGPALGHTFDTSELLDGMAITDDFPCMAREQLYVFDACRMSLEEFTRYAKQQPPQFWDWIEPSNEQRQARSRPVIHTATDGRESFGISGEQSVFSDALLRCLDGSAAWEDGEYDDGRLRWTVSILSLLDGLPIELADSNEVFGTSQRHDSDGISHNLVLCEVDPPPPAEISVALRPDRACAEATLELLDDADDLVVRIEPPVNPHPFVDTFEAGYYTVRARYEPDGQPCKRRRLVKPPGRQFNLALGDS